MFVLRDSHPTHACRSVAEKKIVNRLLVRNQSLSPCKQSVTKESPVAAAIYVVVKGEEVCACA